MSFNYKIIKHIATLSETQDESKQVNIICYNNSKPKVDIRNWFDDNKMGKGITLDDEEWATLGECFTETVENAEYAKALDQVSWLTKISTNEYEFNLSDFGIDIECKSESILNDDQKTMNYSISFVPDKSKVQKHIEFLNDVNKHFSENDIFANAYIDFNEEVECIKIVGIIPFQLGTTEELLDALYEFLSDYSDLINEIGCVGSKPLAFKDIIVISDKFACVHTDHKKEELLVSVDFMRKDGHIFRIEAKACYCHKCNLYFMRKHDYLMMKINSNASTMLCQELTEERYLKNPNSVKYDLNDESILYKLGYNVSDGMSDKQRQEILAMIIERKILPKENIAWRLSDYIKKRLYDADKYRNAIDKWNRDRSFVLDFDVDTRRKVEPRKITVIKYKPSK